MEALVEARLSNLIMRYWQIPVPEGEALRRAVLRSTYSRPQMLLQHLALMGARYLTLQGFREGDAHHLFAAVITPAFVMAMVHDLVLGCHLTPRQARVVEAAVLTAVDAEGRWKAVEERSH